MTHSVPTCFLIIAANGAAYDIRLKEKFSLVGLENVFGVVGTDLRFSSAEGGC